MEPIEQKKKVVNMPESDIRIKPLTLDEIEEAATKRINRVGQELSKGFEFLKNQPKSVTFFGSARFAENNSHYQQARSIAAKLTKEGYAVVSGGGPGIMEGANRGAFESGGDSVGLPIKLPNEQVENPYINKSIEFYYFFTRKVMLSFSAEAYIFFPGGFGTLDEFFEILTLVQTNKIEKVPIFAVGVDFWRPLNEFIFNHMYEKHNAIDKADMDLYTITDDEEAIIHAIKEAPVRNGVEFKE